MSEWNDSFASRVIQFAESRFVVHFCIRILVEKPRLLKFGYKPIKLALKTKTVQAMQILLTDLKSAHSKTPLAYEVATL